MEEGRETSNQNKFLSRSLFTRFSGERVGNVSMKGTGTVTMLGPSQQHSKPVSRQARYNHKSLTPKLRFMIIYFVNPHILSSLTDFPHDSTTVLFAH